MTLAAAPADVIGAYIRAKDGNRPHLLRQAFVADAVLTTTIDGAATAVAVPPRLAGRDAITEALVRRFAKTYENVYTFCLSAPPSAPRREFRCRWLVLMSDVDGGRVRAGTGQYIWSFADSGAAQSLHIDIAVMTSLAPRRLTPVMNWAAALSYPWCTADAARRAAPVGVGVDELVRSL